MLAKNEHYEDIETVGELALIYAILEAAVIDMIKPTVSQKQREEAALWLHQEDIEQPFSASWICLHLELDIAAIRRRVNILSLTRPRMSYASWQWTNIVRSLLPRCYDTETTSNALLNWKIIGE